MRICASLSYVLLQVLIHQKNPQKEDSQATLWNQTQLFLVTNGQPKGTTRGSLIHPGDQTVSQRPAVHWIGKEGLILFLIQHHRPSFLFCSLLCLFMSFMNPHVVSWLSQLIQICTYRQRKRRRQSQGPEDHSRSRSIGWVYLSVLHLKRSARVGALCCISTSQQVGWVLRGWCPLTSKATCYHLRIVFQVSPFPSCPFLLAFRFLIMAHVFSFLSLFLPVSVPFDMGRQLVLLKWQLFLSIKYHQLYIHIMRQIVRYVKSIAL